MIKDTYNRVHDYLRISVTDNCNMRCSYCMPQEDHPFSSASKMMTSDEIVGIASVFVREGVTKIRLTGGEPLVRKDAARIIAGLSQLPVELAITTNGSRLHEFLSVIEEAGIRAVNVSLDTLRADKFFQITRRDLFATVKNNIQSLLQTGVKVKVNAVVIKGVNDDEINDFVQWTRDDAVHVRFIEFMPFDGNRWNSDKVITWREILHTIGERFPFLPLKTAAGATAREYQVPGHAGSFGVISTMSAPFCSSCNRMRLTADGQLKNCLFSKTEYDVLGAWRRNENVPAVIRQAIFDKEKETGGQFNAGFEALDATLIHNRSMISIGG